MSWMRSRDGGCVLEEEMGFYTLHHSVGSFFFSLSLVSSASSFSLAFHLFGFFPQLFLFCLCFAYLLST